MEALDQTTDVFSLFDEAEGAAEPDFTNDVVCHVHSPPGKIEGLAGLDEGLIELVAPFADARVDERLHSLNVREAVLRFKLAWIVRDDDAVTTYRTCNVFPELGMLLVRSHIKQGLDFTEATGDIVAGLVGITVVDFRELGMVADQQQCWANANNGA